MNRLNELTKTINKIEKISKEMVSTALPILESLGRKKNIPMVNEVMEGTNIKEKKLILRKLRKTVLYSINDSENILKEISFFTNAIVKGEKVFEEENEKYPFLYTVWLGDLYDEPEIEGLKMLYDDLKKQLDNINEEYFIKSVIDELKKTKEV